MLLDEHERFVELPQRWLLELAVLNGRTRSPATWRSYAEALYDWYGGLKRACRRVRDWSDGRPYQCLDHVPGSRLSRDPLYARHREVLDEIRLAATRQREKRRDTKKPRFSLPKRGASQDRRAAELAIQLARARSENLTLFYRLQEAEQRLRQKSIAG